MYDLLNGSSRSYLFEHEPDLGDAWSNLGIGFEHSFDNLGDLWVVFEDFEIELLLLVHDFVQEQLLRKILLFDLERQIGSEKSK